MAPEQPQHASGAPWRLSSPSNVDPGSHGSMGLSRPTMPGLAQRCGPEEPITPVQPHHASGAPTTWAWAAPKRLSSPSGVSLGSPVMPAQP